MKAQVVASGIVRSGEDRVQVLLFVNRPTTNKAQTDPGGLQGPGDGDDGRRSTATWLVDDLMTSPGSK